MFASDPLGAGAVPVLLLLLVVALIAPILPIPDPAAIGSGPRIAPPSLAFPMGTDTLGRSVLSRTLQGLQTTFLLSTTAVLLAGILGALIGIVAAYMARAVDEGVTRVADIMFSFPPVLLGLLVTAIVGPGISSAIAVIVLFTLPTMIRVVRAAVLTIRHRDFVIIAEVIGASFWRRVFVHLLPNVIAVIVVQMVYSISFGMLVESSLSFLGLGVQPPQASLGSLLREGSLYLDVSPWLSFGPGAILAITILSVNLTGDLLRHLIDPIGSSPA
jgi:peptide/nickel transport system permease protein